MRHQPAHRYSAGAAQPVRIAPPGLEGLLGVPADAHGIVLFAHGSGSSRFSPRNTYVAERLREAGLATLMFDLLTEQESADRRNVFDIGLLAGRLVAASEWLSVCPAVSGLPCGYFGASTGAAAALVAAAQLPGRIAAVVSRGGRPDMATGWLARVDCPTLLIVGEHDPEVIELNEIALDMLRCEREMRIVPGATHLFEEPGALEVVVQYAREWFRRCLAGEAP
ncbi:MAG: dienelactone hydrolase family protein [Thalassobaculum sp.]|uniref:dienelactone hydrolase family protein n=1 Tax=Thalassobaculum sp. TaxID=2022740 RepID=UPI0032EC8277